MRANALVLMAKAPLAGAVKTRMLPALSAEEAAELSRRLLLDQLAHLASVTAAELYLAFTPDEAKTSMQALAPPAFRLIAQEGGDLGARMQHLFESLRVVGHRNIALIGSDVPPPAMSLFDDAYDYLQNPETRAVLGPSRDGGYYLIGLNHAVGEIFAGMTWSHAAVLAQTRERLAARNIDTLLLAPWFDVDTPDDLRDLRAHIDCDAALARRMKHTAAWLRERRESA